MKPETIFIWLFLLGISSVIPQQEKVLMKNIVFSNTILPGSAINKLDLTRESFPNAYPLLDYKEGSVQEISYISEAVPFLSPNGFLLPSHLADKTYSGSGGTIFFLFVPVPFRKRWWFFVSAAGILAGIIAGLNQYRKYRLLEIERLKNTISADLHDDLGTRLTNIQFLSAILKKKLGSSTGETKYLEGIEQEAEATGKALDEIVWNIRMKDENMEEMVARMRAYATDFLENHYNYRTEITGEFSKRKMSMQKRRELFLIYKELLNNIRKHARATEVEIRISSEANMFLMIVKDNGCGFNPEKETHRNGLRNIKERVEKWRGAVSFRSDKKNGTLVTIRIPYDHWFQLI